MTPAELRLEKRAKKDLHIFMERYRNNTLEALDIYDELLGLKVQDLLTHIFGKAVDRVVEVEWSDWSFDEIADELSESYGVDLFVKGSVMSRKTMSLEGRMTLRAILDHIENRFGAKLVLDEGEAWFAPARHAKPRKKD